MVASYAKISKKKKIQICLLCSSESSTEKKNRKVWIQDDCRGKYQRILIPRKEIFQQYWQGELDYHGILGITMIQFELHYLINILWIYIWSMIAKCVEITCHWAHCVHRSQFWLYWGHWIWRDHHWRLGWSCCCRGSIFPGFQNRLVYCCRSSYCLYGRWDFRHSGHAVDSPSTLYSHETVWFSGICCSQLEDRFLLFLNFPW